MLSLMDYWLRGIHLSSKDMQGSIRYMYVVLSLSSFFPPLLWSSLAIWYLLFHWNSIPSYKINFKICSNVNIYQIIQYLSHSLSTNGTPKICRVLFSKQTTDPNVEIQASMMPRWYFSNKIRKENIQREQWENKNNDYYWVLLSTRQNSTYFINSFNLYNNSIRYHYFYLTDEDSKAQ